MDYIVHHRLKGMTICGEVNLPYGTKLQSNGKFVYGDRGTSARLTQNRDTSIWLGTTTGWAYGAES